MYVYVYIVKIEKGLTKEQERGKRGWQTFSVEFKNRVLMEAEDLEIANVLEKSFVYPQEFLCVLVRIFSNSHKL